MAIFNRKIFNNAIFNVGPTVSTGHSGWFRLWLTDLQRKANESREIEHSDEATEVAQGSVVVPAIVARAAKKTRKIARPLNPPVWELAAPAVEAEHMTLPPPIPITIYQKLKQHETEDEEVLLLLLAA